MRGARHGEIRIAAGRDQGRQCVKKPGTARILQECQVDFVRGRRGRSAETVLRDWHRHVSGLRAKLAAIVRQVP